MRRLLPLFFFAGCGSSTPMVLDVPASVEVAAGQTRRVELKVTGAVGAVIYTATGLPPFARIQGAELVLEPSAADVGEYTSTITAASGGQSAVKYVNLLVRARADSAPRHSMLGLRGLRHVAGDCFDTLGDADCTMPALQGGIMDDQRDATRMEVEVVPEGGQFTQTATAASEYGTDYNDYNYRRICVSLPGLVAGQKYKIAYRAVQASGPSQDWQPFGASCLWELTP